MDERESESKKFSFNFQTEDINGEILSMLLEIRAEIDAVAVFVIEQYAHTFGYDPKDAAQRFEKLKDDFVLKRAFDLQDKIPKPLDK